MWLSTERDMDGEKEVGTNIITDCQLLAQLHFSLLAVAIEWGLGHMVFPSYSGTWDQLLGQNHQELIQVSLSPSCNNTM
jgi:hypothetical protein